MKRKQRRGYREADLRLCFRICRFFLFSHEEALIYKHFAEKKCWICYTKSRSLYRSMISIKYIDIRKSSDVTEIPVFIVSINNLNYLIGKQ